MYKITSSIIHMYSFLILILARLESYSNCSGCLNLHKCCLNSTDKDKYNIVQLNTSLLKALP